MRGLKLALAIGLTLVAGAMPLQAEPLSKAENKDSRRFAANNSLFVLHHEVAHLLFDKLALPVLGREEDAADNFATWTLLQRRTSAGEQALTDAAQGWLLSGAAYNNGRAETDFYDNHSLDKQRAYAIVCLMVGSDGPAFRTIANQYRMVRERQDTCRMDYEMADRSLRGLLDEHGHGGRGTKVTVTYHEVSGRLQAAAQAFERSGVFDQVADNLRRNYHVPRPVQFNAKRCGEANAFYDPETVEVIFCYELMQEYVDMYTETLTDEAAGKKKS